MAVTCPFSVDKSRRPFGTAANMQQSKAREFARSRSHRPASFCWCVREAAPYAVSHNWSLENRTVLVLTVRVCPRGEGGRRQAAG